jgi:hypothetical protein
MSPRKSVLYVSNITSTVSGVSLGKFIGIKYCAWYLLQLLFLTWEESHFFSIINNHYNVFYMPSGRSGQREGSCYQSVNFGTKQPNCVGPIKYCAWYLLQFSSNLAVSSVKRLKVHKRVVHRPLPKLARVISGMTSSVELRRGDHSLFSVALRRT